MQLPVPTAAEPSALGQQSRPRRASLELRDKEKESKPSAFLGRCPFLLLCGTDPASPGSPLLPFSSHLLLEGHSWTSPFPNGEV